MAKLLLVKNADHVTDSNINDLVARYPDDVALYSKEDLLKLPELQGLTEEQILSLVQKVCKKEQYLILTDVFDLVTVEGSLDDIDAQRDAIHPPIKECWYDSDSETWKELNHKPKYAINYSGGVFSNNYKIDTENDKEVNEDKIASLEAKATKG